MNKLPSLLSRPAEINDKPWITVILCVLLTVIGLTIIESVVYREGNTDRICLFLSLSLISFFFSTLFFVIIPASFPKVFTGSSWTIGRMYLYWSLFTIVVGVSAFAYDYSILGGLSKTSLWSREFFLCFIYDFFTVLLLSVILFYISLSFSKNRNTLNTFESVKELNQRLEKRMLFSIPQREIALGGSNNESMDINPNSILYVESSGQFISIAYRENGLNKNKLLRMTIKQIEDILLPYTVFVRCHRAYIVNVNKISKVTANSGEYRLSLFDTLEEIPVSQDYQIDLQKAV